MQLERVGCGEDGGAAVAHVALATCDDEIGKIDRQPSSDKFGLSI